MTETVLFGRYRLMAPAGAGGSAAVWRALDLETGDEVAVKRLHPIVVADAEGRSRLLREFAALRRVHHRRIVRVRDLRIEDGDAAIVLDYVDGESLAERLARSEGALPPDEAVAFAKDIAGALAAAHEAGIVHRDVTPGNILLDQSGHAHLTDFGIAAGSDPSGLGAAGLTATGVVVGTMRYIAPEQLRGDAATPLSDVHALAAVTYEMLASRPAYAAPTPVALAEEQAAGPTPIAGVVPALDAAVRRGLATDPAERPAGALAFAASLEEALGDVPLDAATQLIPIVGPRSGTMQVPRPRPRRVPAPVAVAASLAVALAALATLSRPDERAATASAPSPSAPGAATSPSALPSATQTPEPIVEAQGAGKDSGKGKGHGKGGGKPPKGG